MSKSHTHHRSSIRLKDYDYTIPGAYFITLLAHGSTCFFGDISSNQASMNPFGEIVREEWLRTPNVRPEITLDEYVIMPNHLHAIIYISEPTTVGAHGRAPLHTPVYTFSRPPKSLGSFIAGFKSIVTKRITILRATPGQPVWQRNYYEHIIRDDQDLNRIRTYIRNNPIQWGTDHEYPIP